MVPIWYPKDRARAASGDRAQEKAGLRVYGAKNPPEHENWIMNQSSGIWVPFSLIPIKVGDFC